MTKTEKRVPIDLAEHRRRHLKGVPHKVLCDPEVREFVHAHVDTMTFPQLATECRERFGDERAPSKSALHRYWDAVLREGGPQLPVRRRDRKSRRKPHSPRNRKEVRK